MIQAHVIRTQMVGGGTSYDVYVPTSFKRYRPIAAGCYATVIHRDGGEFYELGDVLRGPTIDALPALTQERIDAFRALREFAEGLAYQIAVRAFPELKSLGRLPSLWACWTKPSKTVVLEVDLDANPE
jgi:hypothetical protein